MDNINLAIETEDATSHKAVRRGYVLNDERHFGVKAMNKLRMAASEVKFLLDRGYDTKAATTFVGNHHLLSNRQRLAIARAISPSAKVQLRKEKELTDADMTGQTLYIDGFNVIIALETAFSGSVLIKCMDGSIRDLAGLRGSYKLIDKTDLAIQAIIRAFEELKIAKIVFYLDKPVSNSGRLKAAILEAMANKPFEVEAILEDAVDNILKTKPLIASGDAIILNECNKWYNLVDYVIKKELGEYPFVILH